MDSKALVEQCYDLFGKGDMEGFMNIVHDDFIWVYPGKPLIKKDDFVT